MFYSLGWRETKIAARTAADGWAMAAKHCWSALVPRGAIVSGGGHGADTAAKAPQGFRIWQGWREGGDRRGERPPGRVGAPPTLGLQTATRKQGLSQESHGLN